ncbi:MFS transporter [Geodermatophilus sp. URMC 62]|uniref:MFS transporter n=1 Tax=Geodermatophilus sp. URMC 62 TaxID=3423414 RepID=UPI00406CC86C
MTRSDQKPDALVADETFHPDPRRWRALSVALVVGFMGVLDLSIVAVALPAVKEDLGASPAEAQWVISGYALTFGLALVPAGRLGDAFGRRRLFLLGLAGFTLGSAAAGAAPTAGLLIAARLAQGLAAGFLGPQNTGLIQQLFRGGERGRAFGLYGATLALSSTVGPLVGGLILALAAGPGGWRWIFYVNVVIGAVAFVLALRLLPRGGSGNPGYLDGIGAVLLGAGALALLFPLVQAESGGLVRLWWLFPVAIAVFAAFAAWERRVARTGRQPVFDPRLVTETRGFVAGLAVGTTYFIGFGGIWVMFAIFFQTGLGYSPLQSGLAVMPFAIGSASAAVVAGRLVERYGRGVTVLGLGTSMLGLSATGVVLGLVPPEQAGWAAGPALLLAGTGSGCVVSPNITLTLGNVPVGLAGAAGGGLQSAQRFGTAIGTAVLPGLFYVVLGATDGDFSLALMAGLAVSVFFAGLALVIGVVDWRLDRRQEAARHPEVGT